VIERIDFTARIGQRDQRPDDPPWLKGDEITREFRAGGHASCRSSSRRSDKAASKAANAASQRLPTSTVLVGENRRVVTGIDTRNSRNFHRSGPIDSMEDNTAMLWIVRSI